MSTTATLPWLAAHEFRLSWREWLAMLPSRRPGRAVPLVIGLLLFAGFMHLLAYGLVRGYADQPRPDAATLLVLSGAALMAFAIMLSQAMEAVTRAFYVRGDLDLFLSSPVSSKRLFAVRMGAIALTSMAMAALLASPFVNMLAILGGARWLASYLVVAALGAAAVAVSLFLTVLSFRTIGPRRTRVVSQIAAAVIGGAFLIGVQVTAILKYGAMSPLPLFETAGSEPSGPDLIWIPARAMAGDPPALAAIVLLGFGLLAAAVLIFADRFAVYVQAAAGLAGSRPRAARSVRPFRTRSAAQALRRKEWMLLRRDPWLLSQTLMQILYLLPAGLMLWKLYGAENGVPIVLVPILVMASGQLSGGLAWLAASGEDAPDLVATAPIAPGRIIRSKIEAVLGAVALVMGPVVLALLPLSPVTALTAAAFIAAASISATTIQIWHRQPARRSDFRRRQQASRIATFAEAFSAFAWAGTAATAAAGSRFALIGLFLVGIVLAVARLLAPRRP